MNKRYRVMLDEVERAHLHTLIGAGTAPARTLTHARILLKANQGEAGPGWADAAIAGALEVHPTTVARVRQPYVTDGPGRRPGAQAARPRVPPHARRRAGGAPDRRWPAARRRRAQRRWTLRLLAERVGPRWRSSTPISHETVRRVLKQTTSSRG